MNQPVSMHPLHPITAQEIERAVSVFRQSEHGSDESFFSCISRLEPAKDIMRALQDGQTAPRIMRLQGVDQNIRRNQDGGFEADIDVTAGKVVSCTRLVSGQAPYGYVDIGRAVQITKNDPEWQAALKKRGITEFKLVQVDPWPGSGFMHESIPDGHRGMRAVSFVRTDLNDNGYAKPIHGVIAHIDLTEGKMAHLEDTGVLDMPTLPGRYDREHLGDFRTDLKPIDISQPQGSSFKVNGFEVEWQKWRFSLSMHPVHGLVLHQLSFDGRPILYRASLSEMVVPYGDKDPMHGWKHVMDASEYCMGTLVNSLKLGCDCLGEIYYFDINQVTWDGKVRKIENAICMHEEDFGIQWKHYNYDSQTTEVRRSRRLVVSSIHTIGNYDYGFYWYLYLDGTIQMEVKLTGIVGVSAAPDNNTDPEYAPLINTNLASPVHQHLFCFRLDFDLDGGSNSLLESQIEVVPIADDNPEGTQFKSVSRLLKTEEDAKRDIAPQVSRFWKIINPNKINKLGQPVAYKLLPGASATLFAQKSSRVADRAGFATHNLWATPYSPDEMNASGEHPTLHPGGAGLPEFTANNREIENSDLVVWHTFGLTHVPRPEDWPVMPVEYCGFHLIPVGFFDGNPTMDLPPSDHC